MMVRLATSRKLPLALVLTLFFGTTLTRTTVSASQVLYYRFNQSAGAGTIPDLSGNGYDAQLPNGGTFNDEYLNLDASLNQWVNISNSLATSLNTQDYTISSCVVSQNAAAWTRLYDFNSEYWSPSSPTPAPSG